MGGISTVYGPMPVGGNSSTGGTNSSSGSTIDRATGGGATIYGPMPVGGTSASGGTKAIATTTSTGGIDTGMPSGGTGIVATYAPDYGVILPGTD